MNRLALSLLLLLPAAAPALASDACMPLVHDGWIRKPPADLPVMAGYARLENPCDAPVTVTAANSTAFADTSIHETRLENGISRMRATAALELPAGADIAMAPGGLHLMLVNPTSPLQAGGKVVIEFTLQDGRKLQGEFELRATAP
ncbi:MAG: copper chaperone PCu(A)C [Pseudomonadota bacterium]|nr:copper chaperone PCu(A)C [Pseudomonadota bacterium]